MAQKSNSIAKYDPVALASYVASIPNEEYREIAFEVGITGIVQNVIAKGDAYKEILVACSPLNERYYELCLRSVIGGLYEHGSPQKEYKKVLALCEDANVAEHNARPKCYLHAAVRLRRFYVPENIPSICREFPGEFEEQCLRDSRPQGLRIEPGRGGANPAS
jgi:hypothetical protein